MAKRGQNAGAGNGPSETGDDASPTLGVGDYRYPDKRKNNPPAKIAAEGRVPKVEPIRYAYSPRLDPRLRFDVTGAADRLPELLETARTRALTEEEARVLAAALRHHEPWLEWAGKRESPGFAVDPLALDIHERISAQAIIKIAARQDVTRDLFADPEQEYREAVQFYQHDIDWTNRLILGDSLQVMASLAHREDLAGKVQMIYVDPPYGIRFGSNFQPEVMSPQVSDKESDMIREPEMVKAYRDTWSLGTHSYLAYLRERLILSRKLLNDSGSVFVQIGEENVHRVRAVLDEIFGKENFVTTIAILKTTSNTTQFLASVYDSVIWYARKLPEMKYKSLYRIKSFGDDGAAEYTQIEFPSGLKRALKIDEKRGAEQMDSGARIYRLDNLTCQGRSESTDFEYEWEGKRLGPGKGGWKTNLGGMNRLAKAGRLRTRQIGNTITYIRYIEDFQAIPLANLWTDVSSGFNAHQPKKYVVQTNEKIIERCILMASEPGDLVLDPTCGAGTTAEMAEQWGRRWVSIDTSRVAIAIARQRLLTAKYDFYEVKGTAAAPAADLTGIDPHPGFVYKTVPHVTLKSIAQNANLDPIFARHEPILDDCLAACNLALAAVPARLKTDLHAKLMLKQKTQGKRAITEADRRRWLLPPANRDPKVKLTVDAAGAGWYHWEVPFETDPDYPPTLAAAVTAYRKAWRAKMDEVNACIAANATTEDLVDQPQVRKGVVRVSGPFTVEAVQPPEVSLGADEGGLFDGAPEALDDAFADVGGDGAAAATNAAAYLERMLRLLRLDGVRFPDNKEQRFSRLEPLTGTGSPLHAEGRWHPPGQPDPDPDGAATVGVVLGPQYGPVTAKMVEEVIRPAGRVYDDLVIAAFSFDGAAQAAIEEGHPRLRVHMAHIRPDVNPAMDGLLKDQPGSQLFSVFGRPRTRLEGPDARGEYRVHMEGVDIYDPVANVITPSRGDKVAAWFVDSDYDGRTFCITQAFFPDRSAWDKLARALKTLVDEERFAALAGTESLRFPPGGHRRVAVKVIDPRGNEVMQVHRLDTME